MVSKLQNIEKIINEFDIAGSVIEIKPYGSGHINDTLLIKYDQNGNEVKYILRKINNYVFKEPKKIIENTQKVTNHIRQKLVEANESDIDRKVLTLLKSKKGNYYYSEENDFWNMFQFIEDAYSVDKVNTEQQAYEAAKAYGKFQKYLSDFDASSCHITIKDFHNLENRIIAFEEIIKLDPKKRVAGISNEIEVAKKYEYLKDDYKRIEKKKLQIRITHNDTKINNIMLDDETNKGLCVVDLDTVMPGVILNDFGDMVRSFTSPGLEDEKDFSKVTMRLSVFDSLAKGYLEEIKDDLTKDEIDNLALGSKIIVYEQAIRFLTDYINGDVYYRVDYDLHNLNRARNQFALLDSIEAQFDEMEKIIRKYSEPKFED